MPAGAADTSKQPLDTGAAAVVTSKIRSKKGAVEAEGMGADDDLYAKVDAALPLEVKRKKQRVVEEEREVAEQ